MKLTSFKALKLAVIVICMLAAGICYSCSVKNRDIGPENMVMALEPDGGTVVEESAGIESPRQRDEPEGGAGTMSAGADGEHLRGQDCMPGQEDVPSQTGRLSEGDMPPREDMPLVYIHVCGLVCTPGVYGLPAGSRVYEAIEAAGGFSEAAVPDYLNLAQVLEDGMKIQVPDREQAEEWKARGLTQSGISAGGVSGGVQTSGRTGTGDGGSKARVNLNTASREELMTLRGIGESRAEDIIHYREEFGGFKSIEDIMNVSGIKDAAFEKIKDSITV
ncbi:helix-hairpin-helix domain-containing protein [Enterocloster clostridioformis]|uniref:helix-hairpin-helix domain-containing protein n=1 Tax=Enterocloster clostridioformis TaxID=1531 RepID=UPI0004296134|nr:helix-hairpin-helix domain-containing protein [Enterocloster clostridioformis]